VNASIVLFVAVAVAVAVVLSHRIVLGMWCY